MTPAERREIDGRINDVLQGRHPERIAADAAFFARWLMRIIPTLTNSEQLTDKLTQCEARCTELLNDKRVLIDHIESITDATPPEKVLNGLTDGIAIKALIAPALRETASAIVAARALK